MALQVLWFVLWGVLWAVYFMLDGFDFGTGMLRNFLARDETERQARAGLHRPGLERQRGLADHGRRSNLCGVPPHLRVHVQLPVPAHAPDPVFPDPAGGFPSSFAGKTIPPGGAPRGTGSWQSRASPLRLSSAWVSATFSRGCPLPPTATGAASGCCSIPTGSLPPCFSWFSSSSTALCGLP